jgi:hypothetical protein
MLHRRRIVFYGKLSKIRHLVPIWMRNQIIWRRIWCPIRIRVKNPAPCTNLKEELNHKFYPKLISHDLCYLIGPISVSILPVYWLNLYHLLICFHVSLWHMIPNKRHICHCLWSTDLLNKIHRLSCRCLILKASLHVTLLNSCNLMILLYCMLKS